MPDKRAEKLNYRRLTQYPLKALVLALGIAPIGLAYLFEKGEERYKAWCEKRQGKPVVKVATAPPPLPVLRSGLTPRPVSTGYPWTPKPYGAVFQRGILDEERCRQQKLFPFEESEVPLPAIVRPRCSLLFEENDVREVDFLQRYGNTRDLRDDPFIPLNNYLDLDERKTSATPKECGGLVHPYSTETCKEMRKIWEEGGEADAYVLPIQENQP